MQLAINQSNILAHRPLNIFLNKKRVEHPRESIKLGLNHSGTEFISVMSPSLMFLAAMVKDLYGVNQENGCLHSV